MKGFVYLLKIPEGIYKIGVSKNVDKRIKQLQTGNTEEITLVEKFESNYPYKVESSLHRRYNYDNIKGEWFYLTDEQVNNFLSNCKMLENNFYTLDKMGNPFFDK